MGAMKSTPWVWGDVLVCQCPVMDTTGSVAVSGWLTTARAGTVLQVALAGTVISIVTAAGSHFVAGSGTCCAMDRWGGCSEGDRGTKPCLGGDTTLAVEEIAYIHSNGGITDTGVCVLT